MSAAGVLDIGWSTATFCLTFLKEAFAGWEVSRYAVHLYPGGFLVRRHGSDLPRDHFRRWISFHLTVWEYQSRRGDLCGRAIRIRYDDGVLIVLY